MKKYLFIFSAVLLFSCSKEIQKTSYEGIVIDRFRSGGGGIGLSMNDNTFSDVSYRGNNHVVEALNIPIGIPKNTIIKFDAREATEVEKNFTRTADGFEGAPIIYITKYSVELDDSIDVSISACMSSKIDEYISKGDTTDVIAVYQYYYNDEVCYLLNSQCCDLFNILVDSNCDIICSPTGGFSGGGDGTCLDFSNNAIFLREIWSK